MTGPRLIDVSHAIWHIPVALSVGQNHHLTVVFITDHVIPPSVKKTTSKLMAFFIAPSTPLPGVSMLNTKSSSCSAPRQLQGLSKMRRLAPPEIQ